MGKNTMGIETFERNRFGLRVVMAAHRFVI